MKNKKKAVGHHSDIIAELLRKSDPTKLNDIECEVMIHAAIMQLLDMAANPKHTAKSGYINILQRLHTDIILRLAAMDIDATEGK